MLPDSKILEKWLSENSGLSDVERSQVLKFFDEINQEIKTNPSLGENFQIGHTYLFVKNLQELQQQWKYAIRPLLKEYVFNEQERLTRFDDALTKNFSNLI